MRASIVVLLAALASGCTVWQRTELNAEIGQTVDAWDVPVFALDATIPLNDRVAFKAGHISDPTTRGPHDPNLTWAGVRVKLK